MSQSETRSRAFFGRRRGKALRDAQAERLASQLPQLRLDPGSPLPEDGVAGLFDMPVDGTVLEIGFGGGEHLLHRINEAPRTGFIGVEPFVNSMTKFLGGIEPADEKRVRLYDDDAVHILDWLPDACLERIDLLYPDPWPKRKHWKRRFVSPDNLDRFARLLVPGGRFRFASDIDSYVNWTLAMVRAHAAFDWPARHPDAWNEPFAGWPGTRYEAKAFREGRRPAYLEFIRR
ncbi:tRNA (guanine(46)-N(7))-methyltransferase TrmB [Pararhizobium mangrovi]|uniref:tRNA (guanine-N(7)-)-methyltransferase n=1 Tax=Pararhizobium mangrovi TaxID=2590452 RepID=A0A506U4Q9_9HYPH|nr:tRNA (guanosine(46)-N(7))-methyltransferase TrmB [Pararhizobium mangrovi]TPW28326.1 tRNA (guanosine(46)-N7)-methyltransferase TrmB [Pararhizobium mangrovi]